MSEWIKIALKAGLVAIMMAAIWLLWTNIPALPIIPGEFWNMMGKLRAIANHFIPGFEGFFAFAMGCVALRLAGWLFKITSNALKWLYQVFE